jgi:hypothetical protein
MTFTVFGEILGDELHDRVASGRAPRKVWTDSMVDAKLQ